jgi:hypothetical protein
MLTLCIVGTNLDSDPVATTLECNLGDLTNFFFDMRLSVTNTDGEEIK